MYKTNVSTTFCLSKDLKVLFKVKLGNLQLQDHTVDTAFVSIQLISSNRPLTSGIISFINNVTNTNRWLEFPISYSQLPLDTKIFICIYDYEQTGLKRIIGFCSMDLFNLDDYTLQKGYQKLYIIPSGSTEASGNANANDDGGIVMEKLEKKIKLHENGDIISIEWLDNLTFRRIEQINKLNTLKETRKNYLIIELSQFDIPVVFSDVKYSIINIPTFTEQHGNELSTANSISVLETSLSSLPQDVSLPIFDPDQYRDYNNDDPIELKFRKLERIHQSSMLDKDIRPTLKIRSKIQEILTKQFFEKLPSQEKNLIWKFRFYLLSNFMSNNSLQFNNFVINFIKCINWDDEFEVNEFLNIINEVQIQHDNIFLKELQIVDCLELLSYNYHNPIIRKLAIERLKLAKDDDLELYFLQLVQALKYENDDDVENNVETDDQLQDSTITNNSSDYAFIESTELQIEQSSIFNNNKLIKLQSPLLNFLIERAVNNKRLSSFFYWYVKVECDGEKRRKLELTRQRQQQEHTTEVDEGNLLVDDNDLNYNKFNSSKFIKNDKIFYKTLNNFIITLKNSHNGDLKMIKLKRQIELFDKIHDISMDIKINYKKEPIQKKILTLRKLLESSDNSMLKFDPLPLPLDPDLEICGSIPSESSVFKSSLSPLKLTFITTTGKYQLMYKIGDDLRQDQFVIQIMTLIEKILHSENLDLKLTPYKILALGEFEGLIEFIPNESLSSILSSHQNSILNFLQRNNPDPSQPLNVKPQVMDNYIRSCAGYCVITYLLGVGDRHLDNLLLTKDGFFFHADFGYILGEDPKPFPPLMKLPIQIIEGMGGLENENYKLFCNYCFITYITLRKNSNLILNLFQLMIDSNIPILQTINGDELEKIELILKIKEKFVLDLNDEEAILHFQNLINDSVNAFLPVVIDRLHSFAQYWRA